ncbi:MAG: helix-turn-helix transcriptional regulator [Pseudomonadota bacterium]
MNNQIRELRMAFGWSQTMLAEQLKVSRQTIHAIESGRSDPSLQLAFTIARLFGAPVEDIFNDGTARNNTPRPLA